MVTTDHTIWKYEIRPNCEIWMPKDAEILSAHIQHEDVYLWALVNPNNIPEKRCFETFGTGFSVPVGPGIERKFIGTFLVEHENIVVHLFERIK